MSNRTTFLFGFGVASWVAIWTRFIPWDMFQFVFAYIMCFAAMWSAAFDPRGEKK